MSVYQERLLVGSAEVTLCCPKCNECNETDAFRFRTRDKLYGLIAIWVTHETVLRCPVCEATFRCSTPPEELATLTPDQLASILKLRVGFVDKFLVIAGWMVVCAGPVSLILFLVAFFRLPRAAAGWRLGALLGIGTSSLSSLFMIASVFSAP
ncbi:hypothetical protein [Stieleria varia]|uniref:Uncharacterized protein n=1 Tax=Stieleria varia TaxID=2528005 RepID=A0A5C5ZZ34_9BACT|nr:hypothetical protein [Stieleria varia]TWT92340.1 hypothetical protein Pla52n_62140 [Stieleria varia]